jgi:hypothetical protein
MCWQGCTSTATSTAVFTPKNGVKTGKNQCPKQKSKNQPQPCGIIMGNNTPLYCRGDVMTDRFQFSVCFLSVEDFFRRALYRFF